MSVEVLVATMNQKDHSILDKMNIQSDAIVGNQGNFNEIEEFDFKGNSIILYNFREHGVGLNRNNILMRSRGTYCLFADDDMVYVKGYPNIVEKAFAQYHKADVILFNLIKKPQDNFVIKKAFRVNWFNFMKFGTARIAIKRKSIINNNIFFSLLFGGGTEHGSGEDSIFLADCLRKGLKIYAVPIFIAELQDDRPSTWFEGYTDKYFVDKGHLFGHISKRWGRLVCLQNAIRHQKLYKRNWTETYRLMLKGFKE